MYWKKRSFLIEIRQLWLKRSRKKKFSILWRRSFRPRFLSMFPCWKQLKPVVTSLALETHGETRSEGIGRFLSTITWTQFLCRFMTNWTKEWSKKGCQGILNWVVGELCHFGKIFYPRFLWILGFQIKFLSHPLVGLWQPFSDIISTSCFDKMLFNS